MNWLRRILGKGKKKRAGFTLVELMIVVIVVAILAAAAIPIYWWAMARAYSSEARALLGAIRSVEQIHYAEYGVFLPLTTPYTGAVVGPDPDDDLEAEIGINAEHNKWWHADTLDYVLVDPSVGSLGGAGPWVGADGTLQLLTAIDDIVIYISLDNGEFLVSYDAKVTWKLE